MRMSVEQFLFPLREDHLRFIACESLHVLQAIASGSAAHNQFVLHVSSLKDVVQRDGRIASEYTGLCVYSCAELSCVMLCALSQTFGRLESPAVSSTTYTLQYVQLLLLRTCLRLWSSHV